MTRTDYLTALLERCDPKTELYVEFRPFRGWHLCGADARWIGDDGSDFMGRNWKEAETFLKWLYRV